MGAQYLAIIRLWEKAWSEFVPFLNYDLRFAGSSARRMRSRRSKPATGVRSAPAAISPPNKLPQMLLPRDRSLDPSGRSKGTMGDEVEASAQRVCDHLQRPNQPDR
jgi:putative transposase